VRLGMTEAKVRALLGKPLGVRESSNDFGLYRELRYATVRVGFQTGRKVTALNTTSPSERTASGIGVGSTVAQVKATLHGVKCKKEFGVDHCWLGSYEPGTAVTDLRLKNGRVTMVTVAYVID
ncbi:MAG: hypothetical protein ACXVZW_10595, partial [Gaiellaceae bacterium]